jgi:hypothetical protein
MPPVGFQPKISVLEQAKTVHALDHIANVIGRTIFYMCHIYMLNQSRETDSLSFIQNMGWTEILLAWGPKYWPVQ